MSMFFYCSINYRVERIQCLIDVIFAKHIFPLDCLEHLIRDHHEQKCESVTLFDVRDNVLRNKKLVNNLLPEQVATNRKYSLELRKILSIRVAV